MSKDELVALLRSVGVNENTVTAMTNAFDMGVEWAKNERENLQPVPPAETSIGRED